MITTINEWRRMNENANEFRFVEDVYGYHHDQQDIRMNMYRGDTLVAYAEYTKYKGQIQMSFIESKVKGMGYGVELMKELARIYGYENLERSSLTEDGVKMRQKLDQHFNFDYDAHRDSLIKHLGADVIDSVKDEEVKSFMRDMVSTGYDATWQKHGDRLRESGAINRYDFNDISEICNWIKGSVTNNNTDTPEVPEYILKDLEKLT